MKTKHKNLLILPILIVGLQVIISRGESFGQDGNHGLHWALTIADSVRDSKMPGAKLEEILGFVDSKGEITESGETNEWTFYYFLETDEDFNGLGVTVYYNSSTFSWDPGGTLHNFEIPHYNSTTHWINESDKSIGDIEFSYRSVQVFADYDNYYEGANNIVYVYYNISDSQMAAYVILNADTGVILFVDNNP